MSKAAGATFGGRQFGYFDPFGLFMAGYHHLANAFAIGHDEINVRQVDEYDAYFAPIIGIDGAGRIENGDAMFECQAAARAYLRLVADRQFDEQSGRNQSAFERFQRNRFRQVGAQIHTGRCFGGISRQGVARCIDDFDLHKRTLEFCIQSNRQR